MKELIYTLVFAGLGILLAVLLSFMFFGEKDNEESVETLGYTSGVYSQSVVLGSQTFEVQVIIENDAISSVSFANMDDAVAAMYPLMQPAMDNIAEQIVSRQSVADITCSSENQYTSAVLLEAVEAALEKAK
jgi:uncharacterized protein with FMN-binding domain